MGSALSSDCTEPPPPPNRRISDLAWRGLVEPRAGRSFNLHFSLPLGRLARRCAAPHALPAPPPARPPATHTTGYLARVIALSRGTGASRVPCSSNLHIFLQCTAHTRFFLPGVPSFARSGRRARLFAKKMPFRLKKRSWVVSSISRRENEKLGPSPIDSQ